MPVTNSYLNLGRPKFVADEGSVMLLGTGAEIDWTDVVAGANGIKKLPAGTLLYQDPVTGKVSPADSDGDPTALPAMGILVSDADDTLGQNKNFHGVYIGGHFYGNLLPVDPTPEDLTALGARFVFAVYADSRLT
jgi:hypothetical protein